MSWREMRDDRRRGPWSAEGYRSDPTDRETPGMGPFTGSELGPGRGYGGGLGHDRSPIDPGAGLDRRPTLGPDRSRRRGSRFGDAVLGLALGAASSTITTALAVGVAGRNADRFFQPIEFTVRVALLLVAPCMGAILAVLFAAVVAPRRVTPAPWAIGLGVVVGPVLALRLDRLRDLGMRTIVTFATLLVCWAVVGGVLAAAATARTATRSRWDHDQDPADMP